MDEIKQSTADPSTTSAVEYVAPEIVELGEAEDLTLGYLYQGAQDLSNPHYFTPGIPC
jgi:hypothetical protein